MNNPPSLSFFQEFLKVILADHARLRALYLDQSEQIKQLTLENRSAGAAFAAKAQANQERIDLLWDKLREVKAQRKAG